MAFTLELKSAEVGIALCLCAFVTHKPPGQKQPPNPTYFDRWNVETSYRSLRGQPAARSAYGGARVGCWKKRMSCCNGTDTGLNVTWHESEPTSDWWYVARKFFGTVNVRESK